MLIIWVLQKQCRFFWLGHVKDLIILQKPARLKTAEHKPETSILLDVRSRTWRCFEFLGHYVWNSYQRCFGEV